MKKMLPISRKELAHHLGISRSTLYRYMKNAKINLPQKLITPIEVVKICHQLEFPIPQEYQSLVEEASKQ